MSKFRLNKDMIGNKVRCVYKIDCYHPEAGTIGTIIDYDSRETYCSYRVQWPEGTTMGNDRWWAINKYIELVKDNAADKQEIQNMTNEEIWNFLKSKMEKNELKPSKVVEVNFEDDCDIGSIFTVPTTYYESDVINAIAIAYRSGYLRAIKGRPFKIGGNKTGHSEPKKEKTGHWVPVDPNNLPKEGTKVRYSRRFNNNAYNKFENRTNMKIGETTVVKYSNFGVFGVKPIHGTREWWCSSSYPDRFDMWVEDDE